MIGVALDAATHATGVVGDDATHRAGRQAGRIRADLGAVAAQGDVDDRPDRARPSADLGAVVLDRDAAPVSLDLAENPVGLCLAGQAGACRPEGDRRTPSMGDLKHSLDIGNGCRHHDDLRPEQVRRRVAGELRDRHRIIQYPLGSDARPEVLGQSCHVSEVSCRALLPRRPAADCRRFIKVCRETCTSHVAQQWEVQARLHTLMKLRPAARGWRRAGSTVGLNLRDGSPKSDGPR